MFSCALEMYVLIMTMMMMTMMMITVTYFKRGVEAVKKWKNSWCSSSHICIMNAHPLRTLTAHYTLTCRCITTLTQSPRHPLTHLLHLFSSCACILSGRNKTYHARRMLSTYNLNNNHLQTLVKHSTITCRVSFCPRIHARMYVCSSAQKHAKTNAQKLL